MILSNHAYLRARERLSIPAYLLPAAACTALMSGSHPEDFLGTEPLLHRQLMRIIRDQDGKLPVVRVQAEHIWLWNTTETGELLLVTIRPLKPKWRSRTPRAAVRLTLPPTHDPERHL